MKQRAEAWPLTQESTVFVVNMCAICWLWGQPGQGFGSGSSFLPGDALLWVVCRPHLRLRWSSADQAELVSSA